MLNIVSSAKYVRIKESKRKKATNILYLIYKRCERETFEQKRYF